MVGKWLEKYWWVVAFIAGGIIAGLYFYFRKPTKKVKFDFQSQDGLGSLLPTLQSRYANREAEKGIGLYLEVPLTAIVKNKGAKELTLNNISGSLSYEGEPILQTKANSDKLKEVKVPAKNKTPVTDSFQVLVNGKTIKFIQEHLQGKNPKINYDLTASVLGDVYSFKDSSILNETTNSTSGRV